MNANGATRLPRPPTGRVAPAPTRGAGGRDSPTPPAGALGEIEGTIQFREEWLASGFTSVPNVVLRSPRLNPTAKVVYGLLLSYAWEKDHTWPGQDALARHLDATTRTVRNALADLKAASLVTVEQRGLRQTNVYWIEPLSTFAGATSAERRGTLPPEETETQRTPRTGSPNARGFRSDRKIFSGQERQFVAALERKIFAAESDSTRKDPTQQQHVPQPPASTNTAIATPSGTAVGDVVALLLTQGITQRVAMALVQTHGVNPIQQQVEWHQYRPTVTKNPAGALVRAIRDEWAPPQGWLDAKEREEEAARRREEEAARRAEEETTRREWEARPPEERVEGRLTFWLTRERLRGRQPTDAEIAVQRAELIAHVVTSEGASGTA